ncbi:zinc-binding dehydrogenase [Streptomyces sp. M19]
MASGAACPAAGRAVRDDRTRRGRCRHTRLRGPAPPTITARRLRGAGARGRKYVPVFLRASGVLLRRVNEMVEDGQVRVHISRSFPLTLEGVRAAIDESRAGRTAGKLVLQR